MAHLCSVMDAVSTSETSVNLCESSRCNILEEIPLYLKHIKSLGSSVSQSVSIVSDYTLDDRGSIPSRGKGFFL
jgi:hypothetical protein